ncbi:MAG: glycosyltransferase family 4 protein [Sedimentisphaerales bacterium]|nr:glycosyltransferase family 4 protein [Sedimentisphaerales bacterium]
MLNYEFPPIGGGAGQAHLCLLRQYIDVENLQVDVLTSAPKPGDVTEQLSENITIYKIGLHKKQLHFWRKIEVMEWLVKAGLCYRMMLRQNEYDLVHAFFGFPTGWLCYRSAKILPYIISLRGSDVPGQHARLQLDYKILAPAFRAIWKNAAVLIANSQGLKERALRFMPSASIEVIPNGVDTNTFHPAETSDQQDKLKLLTVGRLSATKRVEMLIDAVEILHNDGCKLSLTIAGGGQLESQLRYLVRQKKLDDIIEITGRVDPEKMPQMYRENNIFVSASMQEGMSNAMLEAMASGLPIIVTRCEGVQELIKDNGIIIEESSAEAISKAIRKLVDDRSLLMQMADQASKQAEQFTWRHNAEEYLALYEKVK